jgi:hypothetical protein
MTDSDAPQANLVTMIASSVRAFPGLLSRGELQRTREHLGRTYSIDRCGGFRVFRETRRFAGCDQDSVVLVVGFRLRALRSLAFPHWIFQRICLVTTPFWCSFPGFRIKLWMVDPQTQNYLGIYEWCGKSNAQVYVDALVGVLRPLSARGSVWYRIEEREPFAAFLEARSIERTPAPVHEGAVS